MLKVLKISRMPPWIYLILGLMFIKSNKSPFFFFSTSTIPFRSQTEFFLQIQNFNILNFLKVYVRQIYFFFLHNFTLKFLLLNAWIDKIDA